MNKKHLLIPTVPAMKRLRAWLLAVSGLAMVGLIPLAHAETPSKRGYQVVFNPQSLDIYDVPAELAQQYPDSILVMVSFQPGTHSAHHDGSGLQPGEGSWPNRGMRPGEPGKIGFILPKSDPDNVLQNLKTQGGIFIFRVTNKDQGYLETVPVFSPHLDVVSLPAPAATPSAEASPSTDATVATDATPTPAAAPPADDSGGAAPATTDDTAAVVIEPIPIDGGNWTFDPGQNTWGWSDPGGWTYWGNKWSWRGSGQPPYPHPHPPHNPPGGFPPTPPARGGHGHLPGVGSDTTGRGTSPGAANTTGTPGDIASKTHIQPGGSLKNLQLPTPTPGNLPRISDKPVVSADKLKNLTAPTPTPKFNQRPEVPADIAKKLEPEVNNGKPPIPNFPGPSGTSSQSGAAPFGGLFLYTKPSSGTAAPATAPRHIVIATPTPNWVSTTTGTTSTIQGGNSITGNIPRVSNNKNLKNLPTPTPTPKSKGKTSPTPARIHNPLQNPESPQPKPTAKPKPSAKPRPTVLPKADTQLNPPQPKSPPPPQRPSKPVLPARSKSSPTPNPK